MILPGIYQVPGRTHDRPLVIKQVDLAATEPTHQIEYHFGSGYFMGHYEPNRTTYKDMSTYIKSANLGGA